MRYVTLCLHIFLLHPCVFGNILDRFSLKINTALSVSFESQVDFPIGNQLLFEYGGILGYHFPQYFLHIFVNQNTSILNPRNIVFNYRKFSGIEAGVGVDRKIEINSRNYVGVGLKLSGEFDKFFYTQQYLFYPLIGIEGKIVSLVYKNMSIETAIPIVYAFRENANYFKLGLSFRIGWL